MSRNPRYDRRHENSHSDSPRARRRASRPRALPRFAVIAALVLLAVFGMVSVSFALINGGVAASAPEGTLLYELQNRLSAKSPAVTGANHDFASTGGAGSTTGTWHIYSSIKGNWDNNNDSMSGSGNDYYKIFYLTPGNGSIYWRFHSDSDSNKLGARTNNVDVSDGNDNAHHNGVWSGSNSWKYDTEDLGSTTTDFYEVKIHLDPAGGDTGNSGNTYYSGWTWITSSKLTAMSPTITTKKGSTTTTNFEPGESVSLSSSVTGSSNVGTVSYSYKYKLHSATSWTSVTGTSFTPSAEGYYDIQVTATDGGVITSGDNKNATSSRTETTTIENKIHVVSTTPVIDTFTINGASSATMVVNGTATLASTKRNSTNSVTYSVTTNTPTSGSGNVVSISGTTVTAIQPGTAVITASLSGAVSKTVTVTVSQPTVNTTAAISLYIDQTEGISGAVTPNQTYSTITYTSANTSRFTVNSSGWITPVSSGAAANLNIAVKYNNTYTKTFTRSVTISERPAMYLLGFRDDYDWDQDADNQMTYVASGFGAGWYRIERSLNGGESTYGSGGTSNTDKGFKIFDSTKTGDARYLGNNNGTGSPINSSKTIDYLTDNPSNWVYESGKNNAVLKTKDCGGDASNKATYIFYYNATTHQVAVYFPYKITYSANGHGTDTYAAVKYGDKAVAPTDPEVGGYAFGGWYKEAACTNVFNFATENITQDTTVYAKWTERAYDITLDAATNGGTIDGAGTKVIQHTYGVDTSLAGHTPASRTGLTFNGWFTQSSGGTQVTAVGPATSNDITRDTTYYAQWSYKTSALTFNANGGSGTMTTDLVATYNSAMPTASGKPVIPTRTGYTFTGFYDEQTGGTKYYNANGTSAHVWDKDTTEGTTLYAHWSINQYTVTLLPVYRNGTPSYSSDFAAGDIGGLYANSNQLTDSNSYTASFDYGTSVAISAGDRPAGYTFDGIYTDRNGTGHQNSPYTFTLSNSNVTYYACYTKNLAVSLSLSATEMSGANATNLSDITLTATPSGGTGGYELEYSYQIGSGEWVDLSGTSFSPILAGSYTFKVTVTDRDKKTAEATQTINVVRYPTQYSITNTKQSGSADATLSWTAVNTSVDPAVETAKATGAYGGDALRLSFARPDNTYYISSVTITMGGNQIYSATNVNGDLSLDEGDLTSKVTGNIVLTYNIVKKPSVTITNASHVDSHTLTYKYDGTDTEADSPGSYYVDYGTRIDYEVSPEDGFYISGVTTSRGTLSFTTRPPVAGDVTCWLTSVTGDTTITAMAHDNPTVTVVQPEYGSVYVTSGSGDDTIYYFNGDRAEYGTVLNVHVYTNLGSAPNPDQTYDGTHQYYTLGSVTATPAGGSAVNLSAPVDHVTTHTIQDNTTYTANISYGDTTNTNPIASVSAVARNYRRIIFTDNKDWAGTNKDHLYVHYSNTTTDHYYIAYDDEDETDPVVFRNVQMTPLYVNEPSMGSKTVYYADIPASFKYVSFNTGLTGTPTETDGNYTAEIYSTYNEVQLNTNAFSSDRDGAATNPRAMSNHWNCRYADYRTVGSAGAGGDAQQAATSLNKAAEFHANYDYSTNTLSFTKIAGNDCTVTFTNGILRIKPTNNAYSYSLYKVSSGPSNVEKYYLVKLKPFELHSFEGLQRLYQTAYLLTQNSSLNLKTLALGTEPSFTYSYSPSNTDGSFTDFTESSSSTETEINGISFLLNQIQIQYANYNYQGIEYFKTSVAEAGENGESDSMTKKVLFDVADRSGDDVIYLKNDTMASLSDYDVVARFTSESDEEWITMQMVGSGSVLFRTSVPNGMTDVRFYLMYKDKYSADSYIDSTSGGSYVYYYSDSDTLEISPNQMFVVDDIDEGSENLSGEFTVFNN